ncbi:MAG: tRNA (adenosine(37)-N6)-threonylcarbamoyltransferase complex transferase subunit TsaD [Clostridia bacterium]|nr:tRNA (adenosine(37)-N6)-threonylcarbamoyltransferase complex transferase subunit TsaD [Clostridia bacterium]
MKILAIESSCDETAAAVVEDGRKILSSNIASQIPQHVIYGGVVPEIASRQHTKAITAVVRGALDEAGCKLSDLDAIAVTHAPGLIGALLVGVNFAKGLSFASGKPLIPVHHLRSHIAANYLTYSDLKPPFLCLVVSGGHSHIVEVADYTKFRIIGQTRDDAAGETLDKAARAMGLPYPGGVHLDTASVGGNENAYTFPKPKVSDSEYDFSFSGMKTNIINLLHKMNQKGESYEIKDMAASFQSAVTERLVENLEKAALDFGYTKIALSGGVSANSALRAKTEKMCQEHGFELYKPQLSLCGDNAAMVGAQAYYEYLAGSVADLDLNATASMKIE